MRNPEVPHWTVGIGDPNLPAWIIVAAYALSAILLWRALYRNPSTRLYWAAILALIVFLGINKQLDLQTLLTEIGRRVARSEGWYDQRRAIQRAFILAICFVTFAVMGVALWSIRAERTALKVATAGVAVLAAFIIIRAASFHHFDEVLRTTWMGLKSNSVLELGGITIVAIGAAAAGAERPGSTDLAPANDLDLER